MNDRSHLRVVPEPVSRPDLRHTRRRDVVVYRVRADLDDADPPIWRRLDLRSDLTLDIVHQVLQVAFDWTDSHLHRFSLGGGAFSRDSQLFLCPYDVDNKEWEDDDGLPAAATRLDETLGEAGDVLHYLYDYGDNWELTLRVEEVLPAESDCPVAIVLDGERAAPPEDCGHLVDGDSLAEVLADPALFEPERINGAFGGAFFVLRESDIDARLVDLVHQLSYTAYGDRLTEVALALAAESTPLDSTDVANHLRAYQWFLDRAKDGGIALTAAGYLKPADVEEASTVVPAMGDWIGKNNREIQCYPLLRFREGVQALGLLRKNKGTLLLTRAGAASQRDATVLWDHLASRLIPKSGDKFSRQATLLVLAYAAASADSPLPFATITAVLEELGWRYSDGRSMTESAVRGLPVHHVLNNVTDQRVSRSRRDVVSPAAAALARTALGGRN